MRNIATMAAALVLAAGPAAATDPEKVIPEKDSVQELNQPWRPGIASGPGADPDYSAAQTEAAASGRQQANAPAGTTDVLAGDADFDQRVDYVYAVEERVADWEKAVADLDPDTVTLDRFEQMLTEVKDAAADLKQADRESWESARETFQDAGMLLREEYAELPQQRKSEPLDESG